MKKAIFGLFCISVITFSCKKSDPDPVAPADKPYMNLTDGTRWTYRVVTDSGLATQTAVIDTVIVNGDTTVNSKPYKILVHSNGNLHSYYNNTGNDYYQFQKVVAAGAEIEQLYLKDNLAVGGTWFQDINLVIPGVPPAPDTNVPIRLTYTITDKGISKTEYGVTYPDVIGVKTDISSTLLPGGSIVSDIKSYYARNVGLIEGNYNIEVAVAGIAIHTNNFIQSADLH
ncbi:MAG: hypothetical protein QM737_04140 [Ferruginibacter sp.]